MTVCWTEVGFYLLRCVIYLSTNQVLLHKTSLYILFKIDLVVIVPHWEINSVTINIKCNRPDHIHGAKTFMNIFSPYILGLGLTSNSFSVYMV